MSALTLTPQQRKQLRAKAHPFKAVVQVGQSGITDGVVQAATQALLDHELIKVQMRLPKDKAGMAEHLARATGASLCGLVGHTVILYRPHPDKPKITLGA